MKYIDLMDKIFPGYPRQICINNKKSTQRIDIYDKSQFENIIKRYNNKKRIFMSLYKYSFTNHSDFILDKIWLDFDENPYENIVKLHSWLLEKDYKHFLVFSGKGYHCYILTNKKRLKDNKISLLSSLNYIIKESGIKTDEQVLGDTSRVIGLPGTRNIKRQRNVIFINNEDLEKGYDYTCKLAENERIGNFEIYGNTLFDMSKYDSNINNEFTISKDFLKTANLKEKIEEDEVLKSLMPCIANILLRLRDLDHSYYERGLVIRNLIELGYGMEDIKDIMSKYLTPEKYQHSVIQEKQIEYLMSKHIFIPSCKILKSKGYCIMKRKEDMCEYIKKIKK